MRPVNSWGRLAAPLHDVVPIASPDQAAHAIGASKLPGLAHGMGRSYGDSCLNPGGTLWLTTGMDRLIHFDEESGRLTCEAGVLLRDIQQLLVPRGWMLPVTPGTQLATVGGAIANDVHGKNHHVLGSFGDHVQRIRLLRTDGLALDCGPQLDTGWFRATVGGLGLTGLIVEVELQLRRVAGPWLDTETIPYGDLTEFFALADGSEAEWEQTVSWIDCLSRGASRGIFMRANPAASGPLTRPRRRKLSVPLVPPISLVNSLSLRPLNAAYYHLNLRKAGKGVAHYEPFSYPLDNLRDWNRMYGPRGFYQYQSVVPRNVGQDAVQAMLDAISSSGEGSFLAVLKTFGSRSSIGMLGFPHPGVTLALDFPNRGEKTLRLLERLDAIIREAGGRLYPAKDARMPRDLFESGYPLLNEFLPYRDPGISSGLSRRLLGS